MITATAIIEEARTWLETPFAHQGRVKGVGVDCVGLVLGVAWALGLPYRDRIGYGRQVNPRELRSELNQQLIKIPRDQVRAGDIILVAFDREPSHLAIVTDTGVVHAAAIHRKVVEHRLDETLKARIRGAYRFKEAAQWLN